MRPRAASRISDVTLKTGSTGTLCFVSVEHVVTTPRGPAIRERQDIVYRDVSTTQPAAPAKAAPPPPAAKHRETHISDPVLLFRYSALTFNGHRIHYDRDYVTKVEGYPGLIFHGPLQAALIVEFAAKLHGGQPPKTFSYRGVQPLFEGSEFSVNANDAEGRPGAVDRERRRSADDEGHGDVVRALSPSLRAKRSNPEIRARKQSGLLRRDAPRNDAPTLSTSFRGALKARTRNLEIPGSMLTHRPGMT